MCFTHSRLSRLCFALRRNIINYKDIQILFFIKKGGYKYKFLINVYSNSLYTAVNFLSNKDLNIPSLLYMKEDFNIRVTKWNLSISSYPTASQCCSNHLPEWHLWYADFSKALSRLSSSGDYKRTPQGALATLLPYLYKYNVVYATTMRLPHVYSAVTVQDCASCPNVHVSYMW